MSTSVPTLFVYVRGLTDDASSWDALVRRLQADGTAGEHDEFRTWPRDRRDGPTRFSRRHLASYGVELAAQLEEWDRAEDRGDTRIVLVGNSIGSLVVRWAWLSGAGHTAERADHRWVHRVERIVLIAGLSRGFDPSRLPWRQRIVVAAAAAVAHAWFFTPLDALSGSNFVAELRLRWIRLRDLKTVDSVPQVVQILGTRDAYVTRADAVDVEQLPNAAYEEVAGKEHTKVLDLAGVENVDDRVDLFARCLYGDVEPTESFALDANGTIKHVVFVVHGIRVRSLRWIKVLRSKIDALGPQWRAVGPSYGFFSVLDFALPPLRRRRVRWFLDQYTQEVARHPAADLRFVGHSNGTYLLGRALLDIAAFEIYRVYLAGSVLPIAYPWAGWLDGSTERYLRSDRGSRDIPVALGARGLGVYEHADIGAGGADGFSDAAHARFDQRAPVPGGHSAALSRGRLGGIVRFIADEVPAEGEGGDPQGWFPTITRFSAWLVVLIVAAAVVGLPILALVCLVTDPSLGAGGWFIASFVPVLLTKFL
jgi:hypothetical protein